MESYKFKTVKVRVSHPFKKNRVMYFPHRCWPPVHAVTNYPGRVELNRYGFLRKLIMLKVV